MPVSISDVRAVAALARLSLDETRAESLVAELNGILGHMASLANVDTTGVTVDEAARAMPLAEDRGPSVALERPPGAFAPEWRDGFFLVPRLATHRAAGAAADDDSA